MARAKKPTKVKEPIHLRMRERKNGTTSLYLDIYYKGERRCESLGLYLIPEVDENAAMQNRATMLAANSIKSQRIIDLTNGKAGIKTSEEKKPKVLLSDWIETILESKKKRSSRTSIWRYAKLKKIMVDYAGADVTMDKIDKSFCQGFIDYLLYDYTTKDNKNIAKNTGLCYCKAFISTLNAAVREGIITENPFNRIGSSEKIHAQESKREYMTIDEVKKLIETPFPKGKFVFDLKQAYLFSCFCGLRISDIRNLKWKSVLCERGQYRLEIVMQKTKEPIYLPLSEQALKWMPKRGQKSGEDYVFHLPTLTRLNLLIKPWAKNAGIEKNFTFHTARHTFATMMLTLGADLYTVSKLLGHTDLRMTQVYAKIINQKKNDAVNLVNSVFQ